MILKSNKAYKSIGEVAKILDLVNKKKIEFSKWSFKGKKSQKRNNWSKKNKLHT